MFCGVMFVCLFVCLFFVCFWGGVMLFFVMCFEVCCVL